jgi:hypothetical protein
MKRFEEKNRGRKNVTPKPFVSLRAERIVVDKIFKNGTVRLLRAGRRPGFAPDDFSARTWGQQREETLDQFTVEAFVGMKPPRVLHEGDIFYIADGTKLNRDYRGAKIVDPDLARQDHLLRDWDESIAQARTEITEEFDKAAVACTKRTVEAGARPMPRTRKISS